MLRAILFTVLALFATECTAQYMNPYAMVAQQKARAHYGRYMAQQRAYMALQQQRYYAQQQAQAEAYERWAAQYPATARRQAMLEAAEAAAIEAANRIQNDRQMGICHW